jgi:hypothetical protein
MPYSQTEVLAAVLVAACILLLYCQYSKSRNSFTTNIPGLKYKSGFTTNIPGLKLNNSDAKKPSYVRAPRLLDAFDNAPTQGLDELENTGNLSTDSSLNNAVNSLKLANTCAANSAWKQDMQIQIEDRNMTSDDIKNGADRYGAEIIDQGLNFDCSKVSLDPSLSNLILTKTEYEPEYGWSKGSITY